MSAPSGYTALDFVGFTDKGTYNPLATYMRNDLVHYSGNIWKCLVDNTTGITPVEGANWTLWIGTSANLAERTIAPLLNNPADAAFGVGRQVIYDDWLWEVIAPIAIGDTLIDYAVDPTNANIKKSNPVETQLLAVKAEADATDNMIAPTESNANSSSAAYAVGDQLILNNILYTVTAPVAIGDALVSGTGGNIEASDSLTDQLADKVDSSDLGTAAAKDSTNAVTQNSTDLVESGAVYSSVDALNTALTTETTARTNADADMVNILGAKNLLDNNTGVSSTVTEEVTWEVQTDNSVKATVASTLPSGTNRSFRIWANEELAYGNAPTGTYILSGIVTDGNRTTIAIYDATALINLVTLRGNGEEVSFTYTKGHKIYVTLYIEPTTPAGTYYFYPMIRPVGIVSKSYEKFVMPNRQISKQLKERVFTTSVDPTTNNAFAHACLNLQNETSGDTTNLACIGFHNLGVVGGTLYLGTDGYLYLAKNNGTRYKLSMTEVT